MNDNFQILALDGGGIKGIFSSAILAHIEEDLGISITDYFDLIVGTSTGGIIALGLGIGLRPKEILKFYIDSGASIFHKNILSRPKHIFMRKYSSINLEKALINCFSNLTLSDSKKRLVIPSYNLSEDSVYLFKTPHHERLRRDYKVPLWKVGMATCAAPTFFPSFSQIDNIRLIDGGIWANNPSLVGFTEAVNLLDVKYENINILNIGTTSELTLRSKKLDNGGLWHWKKDIVKVFMNSQSVGVFNTLSLLLGQKNIFRIAPIVPDGLFDLDKLNIDELLALAATVSRKLVPEIKDKFTKHMAEEYTPLLKYEVENA